MGTISKEKSLQKKEPEKVNEKSREEELFCVSTQSDSSHSLLALEMSGVWGWGGWGVLRPLCTFNSAMQPDWEELGEEELEFTFSSLACLLRCPPVQGVGRTWGAVFCPVVSPWVLHTWSFSGFPESRSGG